MSLKGWEKKVLKAPGAAARVAEIEDELRLAAGLTALREQAGYSQRDLARRMGISQPRVAAIEQSRNVTIDVLEQYVDAVGGRLEVTVVKGRNKTPLIRARRAGAAKVSANRSKKGGSVAASGRTRVAARRRAPASR
ncbi:MAG: helix-turn-helix domain-containing protein [Actinomycetota bacterium]